MTTMPMTVISMTLSEKPLALHSWPRLFSTLISLMAPSTPMSTLLALLLSPPSPLPSPPPLLLLARWVSQGSSSRPVVLGETPCNSSRDPCERAL